MRVSPASLALSRLSERALPCTAATLAEYVSHLTRTPRPSTGRPYASNSIRCALGAIRHRHHAAGLPAPDVLAARTILAGNPAAQPRKFSPIAG